MHPEPNVAILVDCENAQPAVIDQAMQLASTLGRVTLRRGYGNQASLGQKWQEALVRHGFAPCLQFQHVSGKNTADIALALDALEMLLDRRAGQFVIVTSDSDFVGLCRKLQERGALVHVFGEAKTPAALRHACDRFHESAAPVSPVPQMAPAPPALPIKAKAAVNKPKFVVKAVRELAQTSPGGRVNLAEVGNRLKQIDVNFSPAAYGYKTLKPMLEAYDQLRVDAGAHGQCSVSLAAPPPAILRAV
jgi:uncharacterized protein (TIGR00288 family)